MTDSLGELRAVLAGSRNGSARPSARRDARDRLADAVGLLDGAGRQHSEPLVPPSCGAPATSSTAGCT